MLTRPMLLLLLLVFLSSCGLFGKKEKAIDVIPGYWLVLYPQHHLENSRQREIYGKAQDSIIALSGLKMWHILEDGTIYQADSMFRKTGKWVLADGNRFLVENAGKGFGQFKGTFDGVQHDTMRITEYVRIDNERIRLVWHLKRIRKEEEAVFFGEQENGWRKRPVAPESAEQLKAKLKTMLNYYAAYYEMVASESIYFLSVRVPLPFKYYQHSMEMAPSIPRSGFPSFFYDMDQAQQAYGMLSAAVETLLQRDFPSADNSYVREYAQFMRLLAKEIN